MNEIIEENKIEDLIYNIRGREVMLDSDLAKLFEVKNGTKEINQTVKRNIMKFPKEYFFQLSNIEYENLKSQFVTSRLNYGGARKIPHVFTEQGIIMLSGLLKSKTAIQTSIKIVNTFVKMRHFIIENKSIFENQLNIQNDIININNKLLEHDNNFDTLFNKFNKEEFKEKIFFKGQVYDAYSLLLEIFKKSKKEIIIIDNYVNNKLLNILSNLNKEIIIVSNNYDKELIDKYKKQYNNIKIIEKDIFHDRFIIIDRKELYHCGSSFKDLWKKCFGINKIEDKKYIKTIMEELK